MGAIPAAATTRPSRQTDSKYGFAATSARDAADVTDDRGVARIGEVQAPGPPPGQARSEGSVLLEPWPLSPVEMNAVDRSNNPCRI